MLLPPTKIVNGRKHFVLELPWGKSEDFLRELKELRQCYRPVLIVLIEPKISGAETNTICKKMGKLHWARSEAEGFSGGIWLLWDD